MRCKCNFRLFCPIAIKSASSAAKVSHFAFRQRTFLCLGPLFNYLANGSLARTKRGLRFYLHIEMQQFSARIYEHCIQTGNLEVKPINRRLSACFINQRSGEMTQLPQHWHAQTRYQPHMLDHMALARFANSLWPIQLAGLVTN